jgi:hypothetical protein
MPEYSNLDDQARDILMRMVANVVTAWSSRTDLSPRDQVVGAVRDTLRLIERRPKEVSRARPGSPPCFTVIMSSVDRRGPSEVTSRAFAWSLEDYLSGRHPFSKTERTVIRRWEHPEAFDAIFGDEVGCQVDVSPGAHEGNGLKVAALFDREVAHLTWLKLHEELRLGQEDPPAAPRRRTDRGFFRRLLAMIGLR